MTKYSLVLEGGGIKGIAHVGALEAVQEKGLYGNIKHVAGTSAGSQVATLYAAGFSQNEIRKLVENTPFKKFSDSSFGCIRDILRLFTRFGYHKGNFMEVYMNKILNEKFDIPRITFKELFDKTGIHLKLTGTCLTDSKLVWFDYEKTPFMEIAKAVRISSCIPLYFAPVKFEDKYYVDGGCLRNLPVDAFIETTPIILDFMDSTKSNDIKDLSTFTSSVVNTILHHVHVPSVDNCIRIEIPTGDVSATDFNLSETNKKFLYYSGYNTTKTSLKDF
tara:strand:- start:16515 stop:17342 length:828 start_codon:yes stop_codon:yes gene_type:complete